MKLNKIRLLPLFKFLYAYLIIIFVAYTFKKFMQLRSMDFFSSTILLFAIVILLKAVLLLFIGAAVRIFKEFDIIEDWESKYGFKVQIEFKDEYKE